MVCIKELNKESPYWDKVEELFIQLYDYMEARGILMPLVENGQKMWVASLKKTAGRFSVLNVAIMDNGVVGFACGTVRFAPGFIGSYRVGYISHVFVRPDLRGKGIGKELIDKVEEWFNNKNIHSYELQVLCDNIHAIKFFEAMGYKKELVQMRKITTKLHERL